jgi:tetratricopeptide (TPR) repeat protein
LHLKRALVLHRKVYGANDEHVASSLIDYAWNLGEQGRYADVEACGQEADAICQKLDSTPQVTSDLANALYLTAVAQLRLGDIAGYRSTCNTLVELPPVGSADQSLNSRPAWPLCLVPDALDDMTRLVNRAERLFTENPQHERHFNLYVLGGALYRAGDYERAAQRLKESIDVYPRFPKSGSDTLNYQQLLLAMTKWHLGKRRGSRRPRRGSSP